MNQRLIRVAIAFYPADWRRRYGVELEQLVEDTCAEATAPRVAATRLAVEVAAAGLRERLRDRGIGRRHRLTGAVATTVVATVSMIVVTGGGPSSAAAPAPTAVTLAPGAHLGADVKVINETAFHGAQGLQHSLIEISPVSGTVDGIEGAPVEVKLNPHTDQILSVNRAQTPTDLALAAAPMAEAPGSAPDPRSP